MGEEKDKKEENEEMRSRKARRTTRKIARINASCARGGGGKKKERERERRKEKLRGIHKTRGRRKKVMRKEPSEYRTKEQHSDDTPSCPKRNEGHERQGKPRT